jgi:hypothetical protein
MDGRRPAYGRRPPLSGHRRTTLREASVMVMVMP